VTPSASRPTYATATWLFLRLLGLAYLCAFWSLASQIVGLIGHDGILPTTGWFAGRDVALHLLPIAGTGLAALVVVGVAAMPLLALLWGLYLLLTILLGEFLSYQWDSLLLETGLLAIAVAPMRWRHRLSDAPDASRIARLLLWWLLFRLMFGSGIVKLASGDPTWRDLTAMAVHYETQPLPTPIAWYVSHLPLWFHQATTAAVLAIELIVPWLILFGRWPRRASALILIGLQLLIAATGNYAFFNLLTIALCVMMLDDRAFAWIRRRPLLQPPEPMRIAQLLPAVVATITLPMSVVLLVSQLGIGVPAFVFPAVAAVDPLRSVNQYGLFAVMTTQRNEIVVEGSADGTTWREYEFKHKPGSLTRRPTWIAPLQPRLDWQMWFAALGRFEGEIWFQNFLVRLLEGSPAVIGLLGHNPFPAAPPRFVRASFYHYRFTRLNDASGGWWTRDLIDEYAPSISLDRVVN
jgi:lipase maturation factor 1